MHNKGVNKMSALAEFVRDNKDIIRKLAEENVVRNSNGDIVIKKDDEWRDEDEWDSH